MLAANELRIGNWIEYEGKQYQVHSPCLEFPILDTIEYGIGATDWKYANGIPLTPEILLACGFENYDGESVYKTYRNNKVGVEYYKKDSRPKLVFFESNDDYATPLPSVPIQYLHQLQNLYFALTQEELTYNPLKK